MQMAASCCGNIYLELEDFSGGNSYLLLFFYLFEASRVYRIILLNHYQIIIKMYMRSGYELP